MQSALADFRVENDRAIWLSFVDGRNITVDPDQLPQYLATDDLARVESALKLRSQFMKRVLPPTLIAFLVVGLIGLGSYDLQKYAHFGGSGQTSQAESTVKRVPTSGSASATVTTGAKPAGVQGNMASTTPATSASAAAPATDSARPSRKPVSGIAPAANPSLGPTVNQVVAPITDTTPAKPVVRAVTNLLP